jgi:sarcosine oxidase
VLVGDEGVAIVGAAEDEAERLGDLGVVVTTLDEDELRSYLPMGAGDHAPRSAVLDLDAGAIRVDSAVRGLCALLGESLVRARVLGITERATSVEIMTTEGVLSCEEVVVAAGTETPVLVSSLGLPVLQERLCHVRVVFSVKDGLGLPCMLDRTGLYGEVAYASPLPNGSAYAIGLSGPDNSLPTDMNGALLGASGVVELERRIVRYAETALPQAVGAKVSTRLCLSTPLPSHDDAIAIWGQGRVRAIAGNNMFKFAPLLGVVLADALEGQEVPEVLLPGVAGADV